MQFEALDHGKDEQQKFWGQPHLRTEDKQEVIHLQKMLLNDEEVMIVPKSIYNLLVKHGLEIVEIISEKYPEDLMGEDMQKAAGHLNELLRK